MTDYYVDPAAAGSNNGTDWTNAWTSLQSALDAVTAGNTIFCRGTQTLSAKIDVDTQAGSNASGFIKVIGCNAAGNVDGTRFILDGNSGGYHIIDIIAKDMVWWENIEVKNTGAGTYDGFHSTGTTQSNGHVFINCCASNCGQYGFYTRFNAYALFFRCIAYSNTFAGFFGYSLCKFVLCASRDNGGDGFTEVGYTAIIGGIAHGNTDDGISLDGSYGGLLFNCVVDGNTDDGILCSRTDNYMYYIIGCRITNHSGAGDLGINANSDPIVIGYSYFENNDTNIGNDTMYQFIPVEGSANTSNLFDQALDEGTSDEGYVDKTNHNFATDYQATHATQLPRRRAITIPWT